MKLMKDKKLEKVKKITEEDVLKDLGCLPELKLHCPKIVITTLRKRIQEYERKVA
ncbi:MAG: iron-sulfur cluster assembly scaffold protein [Candidatus Bathyarchaeia archaeon]